MADKTDVLIQKHFKLLFGVILAVSAVLYFLLIGSKYVTADESYTFALIRHGFGDVWRITAADVHPPLYYFLLKIFLAPFGYSLMAARVFSVIPYLLIQLFGAIQLKKLFDEKTALVFMIAFLCFPFALSFAVDVRMYSLSALFLFVCAVFAYKSMLSGRIKDFLICAVFAAACAYTHYFAMVSAGFVMLLLLIAVLVKNKKLFKYWLAGAALIIVLYLPWIREFIAQLVFKAGHKYWIDEITLSTLYRDYFPTMFGSKGLSWFAWCFAILHLVLLICVIASHQKNRITVCICALIVPLGTLLLGVGVSFAVRPVFIIRYLSPCVPLVAAFLAIAIGALSKRSLAAIALIIILIGGISNYSAVYREIHRQRENELDETFVEKYKDCDGYVVTTKTSHILQALAYFDREKPIYRMDGAILAANPYENLTPLSTLDPEKEDCLVYICKSGDLPEEKYTDDYDYEAAGALNSNGHKADVFVLKRKQ